jgi:methionyl-tRNA formyltransferase
MDCSAGLTTRPVLFYSDLRTPQACKDTTPNGLRGRVGRVTCYHSPMRAIFMGSPDFAVPSLLQLAGIAQIVGVVTQPDRPAGRGRALSPPEVKAAAHQLGFTVRQPERMQDPAFLDWLRTQEPDVIVVAAFGRILKPEILRLPPRGCINVHASLLPRWRGASPVQSALLAGDETTGVTIMLMDEAMDTGPILAQREIEILPAETGGELSTRLANLGATLLAQTLPRHIEGRLHPMPQDGVRATYAPLLKKADGQIDPRRSAPELVRQICAFHPWPGSYVQYGAQHLAIHRARAANAPPGLAGQFTAIADEPAMLTGNGALVFEQVQPAGRRIQSGREYLRGARGFIGASADRP